MPTPAYRQNMRKYSGVYFGPTRGKATPKNKKRACLCPDSDTYSMDCCGGALIEQAIGQTQKAPAIRGAFSTGFSTGFDIGTNI